MRLPDYAGGSIVNLMASLEGASGGSPVYPELRLLPAKSVRTKGVILLVLDGLGYQWIMRHGKKSALARHLRGSMTSMFPSTTAACVTTFATGVAAQQHAITGWFMHLREAGIVAAVLPFVTRLGKVPLALPARKVFSQQPLSSRLRCASYHVLPLELLIGSGAGVTRALSGSATLVPFADMAGMFSELGQLASLKQRRYVYAYWPGFDSFCHHHGTAHRKVKEHFRELDRRFAQLVAELHGKDITLIVTADHGLLDTPRDRIVLLEKHPKLAECLSMPLCGESRLAYCYVRHSKAAQFERYVREHLAEECELWKAEDLVRKGAFGLFRQSRKLNPRIGDYILVMKENYVIRDFLPGEKRQVNRACHGGISPEETDVPLVVVSGRSGRPA